jgi:type VI secretion system protein VasJ
LQKESVSFSELIRALRPHVEQARRLMAEAEAMRAAAAAKAEEQAAAAPQAGDAAAPPTIAREGSLPAASPAPAALQAISQGASLPELNAAIDSLAPTLLAYAQNLRQQEPADPRAYVLIRVASWLRFDALPAQQGGRTLVVAPLAGVEAIETMRARGDTQAALAAAEELAWSAPFWLDAHRHSFELLGELGRSFEAARASVAGMLRFFAQRFPESLTLSFNDGRPFADAATRELAAQSANGANGHAAADEMATAIDQARGLFAAGKPLEGLDALSATLRRASSGRQRILWQMAQAQFCVDQGFVVAALPLLDHLDRIVVERDLESWEPELATSVTELRLRTLMHSDSQSLLAEDRRRAALEEARGRMARLDIGATVRLLRA